MNVDLITESLFRSRDLGRERLEELSSQVLKLLYVRPGLRRSTDCTQVS